MRAPAFKHQVCRSDAHLRQLGWAHAEAAARARCAVCRPSRSAYPPNQPTHPSTHPPTHPPTCISPPAAERAHPPLAPLPLTPPPLVPPPLGPQPAAPPPAAPPGPCAAAAVAAYSTPHAPSPSVASRRLALAVEPTLHPALWQAAGPPAEAAVRSAAHHLTPHRERRPDRHTAVTALRARLVRCRRARCRRLRDTAAARRPARQAARRHGGWCAAGLRGAGEA